MNTKINYSLSLEEMIESGKYDWKDDNITAKNFQINGSGIQDVTFELVHFDRYISTQDAEKEIIARGLEVAKIEHLLAFGEKYPDEQRKYPIVALGSSCLLDGGRPYPCLGRSGGERGLDLRWYFSGWRDYCRFLAVRKNLNSETLKAHPTFSSLCPSNSKDFKLFGLDKEGQAWGYKKEWIKL